MNSLLSRRCALAGLAAAAALPVLPARAAGMNLSIIYVSAKDCGPCQVFKAQDLPQWSKSLLAASVHLIEIDAPSVSVAFQSRYWPAAARPFLAAASKIPIVPTFILVDGRDIVKIGTGIGGWRNQVLPQIPGMLNGEWFRGYQRLG